MAMNGQKTWLKVIDAQQSEISDMLTWLEERAAEEMAK